MKKLLALLLNSVLIAQSSYSVISCSMDYQLPLTQNTNNPSTEDPKDLVHDYSLSMNDIVSTANSVRWKSNLEEVNEGLGHLEITGVANLTATNIPNSEEDVLVTVNLAEGYFIIDNTNEFVLSQAIKKINYIYTDEIKAATSSVNGEPNLEAVQKKLDEINIEGVRLLAAEYDNYSLSNAKIHILQEDNFELVGEDKFLIEDAVTWTIEPTLSGTIAHLEQLMRDGMSLYLVSEGAVTQKIFQEYIEKHRSPELIKPNTFNENSSPTASNQISISNVNWGGNPILNLECQFYEAKTNSNGELIWSKPNVTKLKISFNLNDFKI